MGLKFADMARTFHNPKVSLFEAATGKYLETAVSLPVVFTSGISCLPT